MNPIGLRFCASKFHETWRMVPRMSTRRTMLLALRLKGCEWKILILMAICAALEM